MDFLEKSVQDTRLFRSVYWVGNQSDWSVAILSLATAHCRGRSRRAQPDAVLDWAAGQSEKGTHSCPGEEAGRGCQRYCSSCLLVRSGGVLEIGVLRLLRHRPRATRLACASVFLCAAACIEPWSIRERPCPCGSGWTCCESSNLCVQDVADCPPCVRGDSDCVASDHGHFVLSSFTTSGDMGGVASADALCLSDLQANDWNGRSEAGALDADRVRAWLCDGTACRSLEPDTTYYHAVSGSANDGGGSFTTDGSGLGPNDSSDWGAPDRFNTAGRIWTGRSWGTDTQWPSDSRPLEQTCNAWTSSSGDGHTGRLDQSNLARWSHDWRSCASLHNIVCTVRPVASLQ